MSKDPSDLGVDPHTVLLYREGTIGTTWPQIHPHGHLSPVVWLDAAVDKGPHLSTHLPATARQNHAEIVACGCVSGTPCTPIWVKGWDSYL
jgi:hypothetical protein